MSRKNYKFYTPEQKKFLLNFARRVKFAPGTRVKDGGWECLSDDFFAKFGRRVDNGYLSFQARTLAKRNVKTPRSSTI